MMQYVRDGIDSLSMYDKTGLWCFPLTYGIFSGCSSHFSSHNNTKLDGRDIVRG